ncbi:MAG TPA: hypothetical protein VH372_18695 [Actinospica sp.]|nr:hypothetical protein [Actinospica sp.]
MVGIEDHVERQDTVLLPSLVDACPIDAINRLGRRLHKAVEEALADRRDRNLERGPADPGPRPRGFSGLLRRLCGRS